MADAKISLPLKTDPKIRLVKLLGSQIASYGWLATRLITRGGACGDVNCPVKVFEWICAGKGGVACFLFLCCDDFVSYRQLSELCTA